MVLRASVYDRIGDGIESAEKNAASVLVSDSSVGTSEEGMRGRILAIQGGATVTATSAVTTCCLKSC